MVIIIGHGPFAGYGGEIICDAQTELGALIDALALPDDLRENLLVVKNSEFITDKGIVSDGDTIHLFLTVLGG